MSNTETVSYRTPHEVPPLALPSFQATFRRIDGYPEYIGKIYGRERVWGMIPLDVPEERVKIIQQEVLSLKLLAPQLDPQYAIIEMPDGAREEAIVMRLIQPNEFLEHKILAKEDLPLNAYEQIAKRVAAYHFNLEFVASKSSTTLEMFLTTLMNEEIEILKRISPEEVTKYESWNNLIQEYIQKNKAVFARRQQLLNEPVIGHGDIKVSNIIITSEGVGITDPAPLELWKTNDRRMDAYFLYADLVLSGEREAATVYWLAYKTAYSSSLNTLNLTAKEKNDVETSNSVIDLIAHVYRFGIFYRLAKASGNSERALAAEEYLIRGYEQISTELLR